MLTDYPQSGKFPRNEMQIPTPQYLFCTAIPLATNTIQQGKLLLSPSNPW